LFPAPVGLPFRSAFPVVPCAGRSCPSCPPGATWVRRAF
jgi:hypothetical protein